MKGLDITTYIKILRSGISSGFINKRVDNPSNKLILIKQKAIKLLAEKMHSGETDSTMRSFLLKNCDNFKRSPAIDPLSPHQKSIRLFVNSFKTGMYYNSPPCIKEEKSMNTIIDNITVSQKAICELVNNILLIQTSEELLFGLDQYLAPLMKHAYSLDSYLALLPHFLATSKGAPRKKSRSMIGRIRIMLTQTPEQDRINFMANLNYLCSLLEAFREQPNSINLNNIQSCVIDIKIKVCRITAKLTEQVRQDFDFQSKFPFPFNI